MTTRAPRTRSRAKSEATRLRIFDAAIQVFADRGYADTPLTAIAAQAGLETGSLYYYYPSKHALTAAVLEHTLTRVFDVVRGEVEGLDDEAGPVDRIRAAIRGQILAARVQPEYVASYISVIGQVPAEVRRLHRTHEGAYGRYWADLMSAAAAAGLVRADITPVNLYMMIIGALTWTVEWPSLGNTSVESITETACCMFLVGAENSA
ncbi:TetR/AcrR family transcriptional regulator [Nocardioides marmoriginsengisoli]|uniref:TetR/AcrR family transcriptional regulator n=1 Tax=Nocardioides marmoriginsengisoli TaxID=661483 RepID=A0A3N0CH69_9ACTN|nr:TetR/AcrR family transcriptional regulator [Nocardioides marmoriginsengisoli]RNL62797.1 TetR/AcrR family transcriptional regulator [Nocardioides marmoriginsengisoli]